MNWIEFVLGGLWLSGVVGAWVLHKLGVIGPRRAEFGEGLDRAARDLGIAFDKRRPAAPSASGTAGDSRIRVELGTSADPGTGYPEPNLVVTVANDRLPLGIRFGEESGRGEDVLTGDPVFDDAVEVHGEPGVVLALFDAGLRRMVRRYVLYGGSLHSRRLQSKSPYQVAQIDIVTMLRMALELVDELTSTERGGLVQRLARNATADPAPGVRLLNLLQLHDAFARTTEAREASRTALADASPWVRLAAARFLGDGLEVLEALAGDRQVADQAAAEAVALLAARLAPERAGPLLVEILKRRTGDAQRQAIEELGRLRHGPALGPLVVVMERADPRNASAAATALGALGDPRAETSLLGVLVRDESELRLAAARALGQVGTVRSVAPLLELLESRGLDAAARQAVRGAIAGIQSRLVGAGAGQLTVASAESESGRLSLAGTGSGSGDLTLVKDGRQPSDGDRTG